MFFYVLFYSLYLVRFVLLLFLLLYQRVYRNTFLFLHSITLFHCFGHIRCSFFVFYRICLSLYLYRIVYLKVCLVKFSKKDVFMGLVESIFEFGTGTCCIVLCWFVESSESELSCGCVLPATAAYVYRGCLCGGWCAEVLWRLLSR